ncbi:MAG: Maltose-binding periplasmic protein precursor [Tenericutes bacterium ADurb.Bin087]|nr:MAG: Maltose-binding periplasmic protein precursor [Tenericutes bacterium ADurb.Bin087]
MKKKWTLLALLALVLTGCGETSQAPSTPGGNGDESVEVSLPTFENVALTYGNPITGADGTAMRRLVREFNQAYEGQITVTESFMPETDFYESLVATIPMKRSFDIALIHSYRIPSFANKNLLFPLNTLTASTGVDISRDNYIPDVYDAMIWDNKQYGIPLDVHSIMLYYNKDLLSQYSLEVPTNRAELIAAAKKMPQTNTGGWGLPLSTTWPSEYIFTTALYQNGGKEIDKTSLMPAFNNAAGVAALKSVADLIHVEKISPLNVNVDADLLMFQQGKAMFHINGNWMLNSLVDSGVNFGVTSLADMFVDTPTADSKKVASRSHTFVLPQGRNETLKQQAALVFIKYVTENAYLWAESGGHIPASNIARNTEEYHGLIHHKNYGDVNMYTLNEASPYYYEAFAPVFSRVTTAMSDATYDALALLNAAAEEGEQAVLLAQLEG